MIAPKHDSLPTGRKRYPGARPFSDTPEDRQIFFGRDADIDRLFERVLSTRLLVLFGKSGLGKTSLLMAGVFPRLRREKPFLPVPVRLNGRGSPSEIVIAAVIDACKGAGAELTLGDRGGVWEFLRTSLIWKGDLLLTPILVFDQFEEIFTLHDADFQKALAAELGALTSGIPPDRLCASGWHGAKHGARFGEQPPEVKILLSLREEYLGTLQELSSAIPGLFQERVRLAPLDNKDARLAILLPAASVEEPGDTPFATPPFEYDEDALIEMLAFLRGESQIIEPFQLQLLCCRAEEMIAGRARETNAATVRHSVQATEHATDASVQRPSPRRITGADFGGRAGMEAVLRQFYGRVIGMLNWRDRSRARRLCEEGLLSATGNRLMLDQNQIQSDYRVNAAALATMVDERLLRREHRLESLFYEISHDRLAESIEHSRPFRIPKPVRNTLRGAAVVALFTIVVLFWWNRQIEQARSDSEDLVAFLLGESFLEKLRPVGRNAILIDVQGQVEAYLAKAPDQGRLSYLRTRGLALRNAGDILQSRGELAKAIARFRESAAVFERLSTTAPASLNPKAERARSLERLGEALLEQGKVTESVKTHREALVLRQTVYDGGNHNDESTIDLANSNSSVGFTLNQLGQPAQALHHLDRALELLRPMEASSPHTPSLFKALHNAIDNRAESLALIGDETRASVAYDEAGRITQDWIKYYPLSADARARQIIARSRKANTEMGRRAVTKALEQYKQINRSVGELVRWDETNATWRRDFAATLLLMAEGQVADSHYKEAQKNYASALELLKGLAETDPSNMSLKHDLSWFFLSRGRLALARKEWRWATEDFTASERYIAEAVHADTAYATWQRIWTLVIFDLARARSGAGEHAEASALLRRSRDRVSALISAAPEMTVLHGDLAAFYDLEVRELKNSGKIKEAEELAREKGAAIDKALVGHPSSPELLYLTFMEDLRKGDEAQSAGRIGAALAIYRKGLERISRAAALDPKNAIWWEKVLIAHRRIGDALYKGKRWADAAKAYREGIVPGEKAFAIAPHRANLANEEFLLHFSMGDLPQATGNQKQALTEFELARVWIDRAIKIDGKEAQYFDNLSTLEVRIAKTKAALRDMDAAQEAYSAGAEAGLRAVELADTADKKAKFANNVYLLYVDAGDWRRSLDDQSTALLSYEAARPLIDEAIKLAPNMQVYVANLAALYVRIAFTKSALGETAGAEAAFRAGIEAAKRAIKLEPSHGTDWQTLYIAQWNLGADFARQGDASNALNLYREALKSAEQAVVLLPQDNSVSDDVAKLRDEVDKFSH